MALGGLLVIASVLAYAYGAVRLGDRIQVLATARPVAAGQILAVTDLTEVQAARGTKLSLIPAAALRQVIGRSAVVPLLSGTLLTSALIGPSVFPPAGRVTASVAVKPGQYPQGLVPGARVLVYLAPTSTTGGPVSTSATPSNGAAAPAGNAGVSTRLAASVLDVDRAGDGQGATVVTLLLDAADAGRLAAAPDGAVVLMQTAPGGS